MPLEPNNQDGHCVTCDQCHGRMFVAGILCGKCNGDGRILIKQLDLTVSQRAAKEAASILGIVVLVALTVIAALHYFRVL